MASEEIMSYTDRKNVKKYDRVKYDETSKTENPLGFQLYFHLNFWISDTNTTSKHFLYSEPRILLGNNEFWIDVNRAEESFSSILASSILS